jgi:hypothetical protein
MSGPTRFRKRPVVIDAVRVTLENVDMVAYWCGGRSHSAAKPSDPTDVAHWVEIPTLEGTMTAQMGDWVIKGVQGEFYPCKPDIFEQTYEPA